MELLLQVNASVVPLGVDVGWFQKNNIDEEIPPIFYTCYGTLESVNGGQHLDAIEHREHCSMHTNLQQLPRGTLSSLLHRVVV